MAWHTAFCLVLYVSPQNSRSFRRVTCGDVSYRRHLNQVVIRMKSTGVFINGQSAVYAAHCLSYCRTDSFTSGRMVVDRSSVNVQVVVSVARASSCVLVRRLGSLAQRQLSHWRTHLSTSTAAAVRAASSTTFHIELMTSSWSAGGPLCVWSIGTRTH